MKLNLTPEDGHGASNEGVSGAYLRCQSNVVAEFSPIRGSASLALLAIGRRDRSSEPDSSETGHSWQG